MTEPYTFGDLAIGGAWRPGSAGTATTVRNPWNEDILAHISDADVSDVDAAYDAAQAGQEGWIALLPGLRSAVFQRLARIMEARQGEIIGWLVREGGGTIAKAGIEWWAAHNSAIEAATLPFRVEGRILHGDYPGKENRIYREPVGVVGVISPWNWPLHLSTRSVFPALALGNAAVVKPASDTPVTGGLLIAKLLEEAGLPAGLLSVVVGDAKLIGDPFVAHPVPRVISFTGSTTIGRHIGKVALEASRIKRTMLELGGNAPIIVTEDVDIAFAVRTVLAGKLFHQGQMCIAINRIIVMDAIHDAFVAALVEAARKLTFDNPEDPATAYGPIINRHQLDRILALIDSAGAQGARLLLGGEPRGLVLPVHIFEGVTPDMTIARQEIFGPVATILRVADDEEAIRVANDTDYGLTSGVLCRDEGRALRIARRIRAGMTHINDIPAVDMPQMPFGGEKNSGLGRFGTPGLIESSPASTGFRCSTHRPSICSRQERPHEKAAVDRRPAGALSGAAGMGAGQAAQVLPARRPGFRYLRRDRIGQAGRRTGSRRRCFGEEQHRLRAGSRLFHHTNHLGLGHRRHSAHGAHSWRRHAGRRRIAGQRALWALGVLAAVQCAGEGALSPVYRRRLQLHAGLS